jgi:Rad3-related DNA helicase
MVGRGIRGPDDHAETYIVDGQFGSNVWHKSKHLFPNWWVDAVNWRFPVGKIKKLGRM